MLERGYTTDKDAYLKRLRRIEGQIRGLQRMVEDDKYCIDVLTQVSAATRALQSVALGLLDDHLRHCVAGAVASGDDDESARLLDEATERHRTPRQGLIRPGRPSVSAKQRRAGAREAVRRPPDPSAAGGAAGPRTSCAASRPPQMHVVSRGRR